MEDFIPDFSRPCDCAGFYSGGTGVAETLPLIGLNYLFIQYLRQTFFANEYFITFQVIREGKADEPYTEMMARMLVAQLGSLQRRLEAARPATKTASDTVGGSSSDQLAQGITFQPATVITLLISQPVNIETGLLQPVNVKLSVGGIDVGGVLAWLHRGSFQHRTITFSVLEHKDKTAVSADLTGFVRSGDPHLLLQSPSGVEEVTTRIAYALIQRKLAEKQTSHIAALDPDEFKVLLDTHLEVARLNERTRQHRLVDTEFGAILPGIEELSRKIPHWAELTHLVAQLALNSGNTLKATRYFQMLDRQVAAGQVANPEVVSWVDRERKKLGVTLDAEMGQKEQRFVQSAVEFARLMKLDGPDPVLEFKRPDHEQVQAIWNSETQHYEVNPEYIDTVGLPQYVALMGRFMAKNFDRCFGKDGEQKSGMTGEFWNEFRYAVVDYLIHSVPQFADVEAVGTKFPLFQALKRMERGNTEPVRRLALELLDRFDCDWNKHTLAAKALEIVRDRGLMSESVVKDAFASS